MKPKRIILIRHGQSEGNADPDVYKVKPDYVLELSDKGLNQAKEAGQELQHILNNESMFFYVSPFWRARSTFEQIVKHNHGDQYKFIEEPRLREQERGHLRATEENKKIENEQDAYGPFFFRFPGGESCADVYDSVSDFFGTFHRDFEKENFPENAVIITHGMTIKLFLMRWFHWNVEKFESFANPENCQLVIMERDENGKYNLKSELKTHMVKHKYQRPVSG